MSRTKSSDVKITLTPLRAVLAQTAAERYFEAVKTSPEDSFGFFTKAVAVTEAEEMLRTIRSANIKATAKATTQPA